jgi:16S rRNA (guanine527-N7)-methyltransferase
MEKENRETLVEGAKSFGIHLGEEQVEAFDVYLRELLKWNKKINLTAIRTERGIVVKHFLDSLSAYPHLSGSSSLLDIGSGPGFPGIPLKIVKPSLEATLIDSVRKKVDFQRHVIRSLGLKGIEAIHGRAQDRAIVRSLGNRFDVVISRAFSDLHNLLVFGFPFLKKGGLLLALKGETVVEELGAPERMEGSGYRLGEISRFTLPFSSFKRSILLFQKE